MVSMIEKKTQIEAAVDCAEAYIPEPKGTPSQFVPFPVDVLPATLRNFITEASRASGYDPAFVALPLLAACGSAIGNTRRLALKRGWSEPPIIWSVIVGDSGTLKSPAIEAVLAPIRQREKQAMKEHVEQMEDYEVERLRHKISMRQWESEGGEDLPPAAPEAPTIDRCQVVDTTIEALAPLPTENWRGLLLARDELADTAQAVDALPGL